MEEDGKEYIDCECPSCKTKMKQPKWLLDIYEREGDVIYCSEQCRYNSETGSPGEEY